MRDPVVLPSGETYERHSILRAGLKDPQTREQLEITQLTSNRALRRQIDRYLQTSVENFISSNIEGLEVAVSWPAISEIINSLGEDISEPAL